MIATQAPHSRDLVRRAVTLVGPGWFTSVMGTGILAICVVISPVAVPFARPIAETLWSFDLALFVALTAFWIVRSARHPSSVVASLCDPATAQLWGAPPMAAFTIAVGFLRIGERFLPLDVCVAAAQVLWIAGVAGSIFCAFLVPFLMFTSHDLAPRTTAGNWLLSIVPPIVASVPAALLSPTWPEALRGTFLALAYALLGIGIMLAAIVIVLFYARLVYQKVPDAPLVPTMWIVVGPLGQSIAGINALGAASVGVWPAYGHGLVSAGLAYGVLVWGFAMYWLAMAIAITVRAAYRGLPFSLGWWAFTFPVGVLTAGTDALYGITRAPLFAVCGVALLILLAVMWALVAGKTAAGIAAAARVLTPSAPGTVVAEWRGAGI